MRKKIVAGNWKMNNDLNKSLALISDLLKKVPQTEAEVMIAPTFVNLLDSPPAGRYCPLGRTGGGAPVSH